MKSTCSGMNVFSLLCISKFFSKERTSLQSVMSYCAGNLVYCWTPTLSTTSATTTSPTMVVLGTQDKVEDSSWSVFNFHPVTHSAMSAGFFLLVIFFFVMFWFCCRSIGSSGLKKIKAATMPKQTPDILKDLERANTNSNASAPPANIWEMTKRGVPAPPPMPKFGFGMPPQSSMPWNAVDPEKDEIMKKLDGLVQESRETQRNLYRTCAKMERFERSEE